MAKNAQYYQTEQELAKLFRGSGLPQDFTNGFIKDYASVKRDVGVGDANLEELQIQVNQIDSRTESLETNVSTINSQITSITAIVNDIDARLGTVEVDFSLLSLDFTDHVNATEAHGATGDIVGTDDFCTILVGGTVLQATPLALSAASTISTAGTPNAAPVAYSQADAATWVALLNEIKSDFNSHIIEFNILLNKVNAIITTQVAAKQRGT